MAEKQTSKNIIRITEDAVKKFLAGVSVTQRGILRRINGLLRDLEISNGDILPNRNNIRQLNLIKADLTNIVVDPAYKKRVNSFLLNFDRIKKETDALYALQQGFNANKQVFKEVLRSSVDLTKNSLLEAGINQNVINPMIDILNNGITAGSNLSEMEETLRTLIVGDNQRLGGLERYVSQISRDALNQYASNYNDSISTNLGMEWYFYSGTLVDDSRSYCIERAGKYFHIKEVQDVPSQWAGKIPGTNSGNILIRRGGYNCSHLYLAVLINVVPNDVIQRNINNGNYVPL